MLLKGRMFTTVLVRHFQPGPLLFHRPFKIPSQILNIGYKQFPHIVGTLHHSIMKMAEVRYILNAHRSKITTYNESIKTHVAF
jgi:hypothetical protein